MIPLKDENPTQKNCYTRYVILFICLVVFLLFKFHQDQSNLITYYFGFKLSFFLSFFDKPTFFQPLHF